MLLTLPPRRFLGFVLTTVLISTLLLLWYQPAFHLPTDPSFLYGNSAHHLDKSDLGFVKTTYIVSLPHRSDRREDMTYLMKRLGISQWHFYDGVYANASSVENLMRHVLAERSQVQFDEESEDTIHLPFSWPVEVNSLARVLYHEGSDVGFSGLPPAGAERWNDETLPAIPIPPMLSAENDFSVQKHSYDLPQWRQLTPARIATYEAHLKLIRRIVDDNTRRRVPLRPSLGSTPHDITLILEDDIDVEVDIERRMAPLLPLLPYDWDILYLGFCWSQEASHPPIEDEYITPKKNSLHPSYQPRCTHAYALSPAGAVRVLAHLRYPPFAYSRPIDLALEWLIWTKRINAYTVVPPPIIQRKMTKSDVVTGDHGHWDETLEHGVFGTRGHEV